MIAVWILILLRAGGSFRFVRTWNQSPGVFSGCDSRESLDLLFGMVPHGCDRRDSGGEEAFVEGRVDVDHVGNLQLLVTKLSVSREATFVLVLRFCSWLRVHLPKSGWLHTSAIPAWANIRRQGASMADCMRFNAGQSARHSHEKKKCMYFKT